MRLPYLVVAVVCDVLLLSAPRLVTASEALWIQPSGEWYGIDGNWSSFGFAVGAPAQIVYLTVATALSEIWVVETGGCSPVQLCTNARGGVFDITASQTWRSLGSWQLANYTGWEGNGDYGLETLAFVNTVTRIATGVDGALVAAINDTDYYQGFVGVGVNQGRFGSNLTNPLVSQLAETYGTIPSHSYGYTAGAYYRNTGGASRGTVGSLTFGGYDTLRFVPHATTFSLDPENRIPTVLIRGITAQVTSLDKAPSGNWTSTSQKLLTMDSSVRAIIDTSTPYLWLPTEVCDRFAAALNLTWRDDLGVYVFSDQAEYVRYQSDTTLSFTFSVSSYDNSDNFGQPLNMPGVVNITIPPAAFAQLLHYPFKNVIKFGDPGVPYFPLKRSTKEVNNNQYIIGRAFMQEAYLITNYDRGTFSLHQALFPEKASTTYSLKTIERPPDSPFPTPTATNSTADPGSGGGGLNPGQTVGIVLSAFASGSVIGLVLWLCCRRRKKWKGKREEKRAKQAEENKAKNNATDDDEPTSPVKRMFSIITGKKRSKKLKSPAMHEVDGTSSQPAEVSADVQHQLFELPVPPEPVELDSKYVGDEDTDLGIDSVQELSEYEMTRRKLERHLQGPVPTYLPTTCDEKTAQDVSAVAHYRPSDEPSPASSPTYANTSSLPDSLPSPLTVHPDWAARLFDLPSPMTVAPTFHPQQLAPSDSSSSSDPSCSYSPVSPHTPQSSQTFAPSSVTRSELSNMSPASPIGSMRLPSPTFQRTPIDPTRVVVCLGPLPENVRLPHHQSLPQIVTPNRQREKRRASTQPPAGSTPPGAVSGSLKRSHSSARGSNETLGSNFTVEEENRLKEEEVTSQLSTRDQDDSAFPRSPRSMERIETGSELVHVPQVAEKRYSWEPDQDRR
ncbi:aspartic peptidase domain-containing protein [Lasiosphaeria miniovina]|uniref:Aspartic peptidase domain-containing protein n=1 Tax=Lasiosphaeria miniovina TaxID=1954250 RepID=A0AA40E047_9PEZI|nr:aspartic peptidase domain-containing protein [Lasiosphaeria miniovina]KAK0722105.1 aspartic peptidase domain-containing protein [Lasiosphaeria miniovina]